MCGPRCRRLLLFALCSFVVLGATALAAAPSNRLKACAPAAFTGSVRARFSRCVPQPPVLSLNNPSSEAAALTITPLAGGTDPAAASLVIERLN